MTSRRELPWQFRQLLTMEQLGAYLGKSRKAARTWALRAAVRGLALQKCGREWRVDRRDIDALLERDTRAAKALRSVSCAPISDQRSA